MSRRLFVWALLLTILVAAICTVTHFREVGYRTKNGGAALLEGHLEIGRWKALSEESQGFYVGRLERYSLLFSPSPVNAWIYHRLYDLWFLLLVYVVPVLVLLLVVEASRRISGAACLKLSRVGLLACVLVVAVWLTSYWCIMYLAPWKGEYFVMDGGLHASPWNRDGYFDAALHWNPKPAFVSSLLPQAKWQNWRVRGVWLVPLWMPGAVVLAATVVLFCRKSVIGLCVNCRYDLTGNTSGVCPECGEAVVKTS